MNTERVGREVKLVFLQRSLLVNFIIPPIGNDFGFWILDFGLSELCYTIDATDPSVAIGV
jgi:hypothetical protein